MTRPIELAALDLAGTTVDEAGPHRVLAAGDTPNDLAAGTNAGAGFVVGVLTGSFDAATLGRERHTHLLPGVAQLPEIL